MISLYVFSDTSNFFKKIFFYAQPRKVENIQLGVNLFKILFALF